MSRRRSTKSRTLVALLIAAGILAAAGCGEEEPAARSLRVDAAADGSLRFQREAVETTAGRVAIEMANPSGIPHAIGIRGDGIDETGETVGRGGTSRIEAEVEPGRYVLFCPVGGHEEAGMTATLTVR
jgi:plastocyanin